MQQPNAIKDVCVCVCVCESFLILFDRVLYSSKVSAWYVRRNPFLLCFPAQVGLFRKSGVKSRIQALRQMNEASGADGGGVNYEGQSAYDVADMLKQYFRDLPEPLLTSKLSETFLQIYQCKKTQNTENVLPGSSTSFLAPLDVCNCTADILCFRCCSHRAVKTHETDEHTSVDATPFA